MTIINKDLNTKLQKNINKRISYTKLVSIFALILSITSILIYSSIYVRKTTELITEAGPQAKLILEPSSGTYSIGEEYVVHVILDTNNAKVNAVDLKLLYDSDVLEIIDVDDNRSGIQSEVNTNAFGYIPVNSVDTSNNQIDITMLAYNTNTNLPANPFNGKQSIASIRFRPVKSASESVISFRYTNGASNDSNVADANSNQDILGTTTSATYKVTAPAVSINARGVSDKNISPKLRLSVKDSVAEKIYSEEDISNTDYEDIEFPISQRLSNGNIVYFDFENDTRDTQNSKTGASNRDIYIKTITLAGRTFYLDPQDSTQRQQAIKDKDEGRIYYDRADRDDGQLYDDGRFGKFGNARDGSKDDDAKLNNGYLEYNSPLGFGPNFTGQILWNGAIVIKIDWVFEESIKTTQNTSSLSNNLDSPLFTTNNQITPLPAINPQVSPQPVVPTSSVFNPVEPKSVAIVEKPANSTNSLTRTELIESIDCTEPTGEEYGYVFLNNSLNDMTPSKNSNFNLSLKGYKVIDNSNLKTFINTSGAGDLLAPNLYALLAKKKESFSITNVYRVDNINNPLVSMISILSDKNQMVRAPSSGYVLENQTLLSNYVEYKSVVIYADNNSLALNYTLDDTTSTGYTIYLENICVDKNLLKAYQNASPSGVIKRTKLPALKALQPVGRVNGTQLLVSVSNKNKFIDTRSKRDLWR